MCPKAPKNDYKIAAPPPPPAEAPEVADIGETRREETIKNFGGPTATHRTRKDDTSGA